MASDILIAFSTFPDAVTAEKTVREMVEQNLVACGNVLPIRSIYRWRGGIETADETLAIFKMPATRYSDFESKLRALHPYEIPEIIAWPVERGLAGYLHWVTESCGQT